jgi:hypothetical protein
MSDLFGGATCRKPVAHPSQNRLRQVRRPKPPVAPVAATGPVAKLTEPVAATGTVRLVVEGSAGPVCPSQSKKKDGAKLRAERDLLRMQLADWNQSLDLRRRALAPMQGAFVAAHETAAWEAERAGPPPRECSNVRARVLAAYEKRRHAGMAAHPYRLAVAEAERAVRAIKALITEITEELDHA